MTRLGENVETEVETIIAQLCGCIDTGTLSKYGKNSRVEDVKKRRGEMTLPNNINFDEVFNLEEMCNTKMGKKLKALNFRFCFLTHLNLRPNLQTITVMLSRPP